MTTSFFTGTAQSLFTEPVVTFAEPKPKREQLELPSDFVAEQIAARDEAEASMIAALDANDHDAFLTARANYRRARRSIRSHYRYHAARYRDASKFPLSHDDHLASVAHQANYHDRGDVERRTAGLGEVSEWRPPLLRKMDASAGIERVTYRTYAGSRFDGYLVHIDIDCERFDTLRYGNTESELERVWLIGQQEHSRADQVVTVTPVLKPAYDEEHDWLSISQRDQINGDRDRDELASDFTLSALAEAERLGVHVDDLDRGMSARSTNTYRPAE